ncbi:MAG: hypothetical protein AB1486_29315 [Planctomycetota bacterium]
MTYLLLCLIVALPPDISYQRVIKPEIRREFYRTGGRAYLGERVRLYVEASVLKNEPVEVTLPNGARLLEFPNHTVPLLISPHNKDYQRLQRYLFGPRLHKVAVIAVRGQVIPTPGSPRRCSLLVHGIKRTPSRIE